MNNEKLIELVRVQSELLKILIKEYNKDNLRPPREKEEMTSLKKSLEELSKEFEH